MDQIEKVDQKALTIIEEANLVIVTNAETYTYAGGVWKSIKDMMKKVDKHHDDVISLAHQTHKKALKKKAEIYDPLKKAHKHVKYKMEKYDFIQEEIRKEEETRFREIARKEEEERQLTEALEAEQNGEKEAAEAILESPAYVPPVVIPKTTPKLKGGPVYRTVWKFKIINDRKIPKEFMTPDLVRIGQVVRAMKDATNIPGIEVYSERV